MGSAGLKEQSRVGAPSFAYPSSKQTLAACRRDGWIVGPGQPPHRLLLKAKQLRRVSAEPCPHDRYQGPYLAQQYEAEEIKDGAVHEPADQANPDSTPGAGIVKRLAHGHDEGGEHPNASYKEDGDRQSRHNPQNAEHSRSCCETRRP